MDSDELKLARFRGLIALLKPADRIGSMVSLHC